MIQNCVWVTMKNKRYKLGNDFPIFNGKYKNFEYSNIYNNESIKDITTYYIIIKYNKSVHI